MLFSRVVQVVSIALAACLWVPNLSGALAPTTAAEGPRNPLPPPSTRLSTGDVNDLQRFVPYSGRPTTPTGIADLIHPIPVQGTAASNPASPFDLKAANARLDPLNRSVSFDIANTGTMDMAPQVTLKVVTRVGEIVETQKRLARPLTPGATTTIAFGLEALSEAGDYTLVLLVNEAGSSTEKDPNDNLLKLRYLIPRPLNLPPETYVLFERAPGLVPSKPSASEVSVSPSGLSFHPDGGIPPASALVYLPWIESILGAVGSPVEFRVVDKRDGQYAVIKQMEALSGTTPALVPLSSAPTSLYTLGSDDTIRLRERPMLVWIKEVPALSPPGKGRLVVNFESNNHAGQRLALNRSWMDRLGLPNPTFVHENGDPIAFDAEPDAYVLSPAHFSDIVTIIQICTENCPGPTNEPPTADFTATPADGTLSTRFFVDASASTDDRTPQSDLVVQWDWGDGSWTALTKEKTASHTYTTRGTKTITLYVQDAGAQRSATTRDVRVNLPPAACFAINPAGAPVGATFALNASCTTDDITPPANLQVRWDLNNTGAFTPWTTTKTTTNAFATKGTKTIRLEVKDQFNEIGNTTRTVMVSDPPTACFTLSPAGGETSTNFTVDASCSTDDLTSPPDLQVRWDWGSGVFTPWTTTKTATNRYATSGTRTIRLQARDGSQLTSDAAKEVLVNDPPQACFTLSGSLVSTNQAVTVGASCSRDDLTPLGSLQLRWDWTDDGAYDTNPSTAKTATTQYATRGLRTIRLEVRDAHGALGTTTRQVMVDDPSVACFTASPSIGPSSTRFTLNASCSTDETTPTADLQVRWSFNNDATTTGWSTQKTAETTYSSSGTKTIRLEVMDQEGQVNTTMRQVTVDNPPTPCLTAPAVVATGGAAPFDARCSTDDLTPASDLQVRWDWYGDGTAATAWSTTKTASHAYATPGTKHVNLSVKDANGFVSSRVHDLVVDAPPSPVLVVDSIPDPGTVESTYWFYAGSSTDDRTPTASLLVRWDLDGDGTYEIPWTTTKDASKRYDTWGTKTVRLQVKDEMGQIATAERDVVVLNSPPTLTSGQVAPGAGTEDTPFTYSVVYKDADNAPPQRLEVVIDGVVHALAPTPGSTASVRDGKRYEYTTKLTGGVAHAYFFRAVDDGGTLTATGSVGDPVVSAYAYLADDTEQGANGWTATGLWHLQNGGAVPAWSGSTSWWFGSASTGTYGTAASGTLTSKTIDLRYARGPVRLSFLSWSQTDGQAVRTVDVSVDGGAWQPRAAFTDAWDNGRWYPRGIDLSGEVGKQIRIRFSFTGGTVVSGAPRGWLVDSIAVGSDTDGDDLTDYFEDTAAAVTTSRSGDHPFLLDYRVARAELFGLDAYGVYDASAIVTISHSNWADLTIKIVGERTGACTLWNHGYLSGAYQLTADLLRCPGFTPAEFKKHQKWWVEVSDDAAYNLGRLLDFKIVLASQLNRVKADADGDKLGDGDEVLKEASSPVTQDIDNDGLLDSFDMRPWIEDQPPTLNNLEGLNQNFQTGIQFQLTDNMGPDAINRSAVTVKVIQRTGGSVSTPVTYDANTETYKATWPPMTSEAVAFEVNATDVNANNIAWRANLTITGGTPQNSIKEMQLTVQTAEVNEVASGFGRIIIPAAFAVGMVTVGIVAVTFAIAYCANVDCGGLIKNGNRGHAAGDPGNGQPTIEWDRDLTPFLPSILGSAAMSVYERGQPVDIDIKLPRGNPNMGWERIKNLGKWATPKDLLDYLKGHQGDSALVEIAEDMKDLFVRDVGTGAWIIVHLARDLIQRIDWVDRIQDWKKEKDLTLQVWLEIYTGILASVGLLADWFKNPPPPMDGDDLGVDCSNVSARDLKISDRRWQHQYTFCFYKSILKAYEMVAEQGDTLLNEVMNSVLTRFITNRLQSLAEQGKVVPTADWFWGRYDPLTLECGDLDRRRCNPPDYVGNWGAPKARWSLLPEFKVPDMSRPKYKWGNVGPDGVSIGSLNANSCDPRWMFEENAVNQARNGFQGQSLAGLAATLPVGLAVGTFDCRNAPDGPGGQVYTYRTVYLEYAQTPADFN